MSIFCQKFWGCNQILLELGSSMAGRFRTQNYIQADAVESVESELETAKDRLRKNVEAVEGINKSIMVFESRHVETVERMKEVRGQNDDPQQNNVGIGI